MPSCYVARDGSESVSTTVLIPRPIRDAARERGISLSGTLTTALKAKIEDLERAELGGTPAPGHHPRETEANNIAS